MSELSQDQIEQFKTRLQDRAAGLQLEVRAVESDRSEALSAARDEVEDAGDEAEIRREDEVRNAEEDRDQGELRDIEAALIRIERGEYGSCVDCDEDIPLARLQARPEAARCVGCQESSEKAGGVR